ncbi:Uncharacterised protein [Legionella bozemanae]|uniref:Uncharacterized protein n=1 Tax=Legionella bozemanae TaxID=447 RepID=A0A0W0RSD8_LEGBO|nr:hypothetical protein Lboz_1413 [Legionella bozemanae]STO33560.1 Uncharacterised protein [Legionella bozemanae]
MALPFKKGKAKEVIIYNNVIGPKHFASSLDGMELVMNWVLEHLIHTHHTYSYDIHGRILELRWR